MKIENPFLKIIIEGEEKILTFNEMLDLAEEGNNLKNYPRYFQVGVDKENNPLFENDIIVYEYDEIDYNEKFKIIYSEEEKKYVCQNLKHKYDYRNVYSKAILKYKKENEINYIEKNIDKFNKVNFVKIIIPIRYEEKLEELKEVFNLTNENLIELLIDYKTGKILNEEKNINYYLHLKVCDEGEYFLLDENKKEIFKKDSYIPNCIPNLYGDYIELDIKDNIIKNWKVDYNFYDFYEI